MAGQPTEEDRTEAIRRLLSGLERGSDAHELAAAVADLHPKNNTFPGEVFMEIAADALEIAGISRHASIPYEGLREAHLPECSFRGRENRKIQYAILTSAAFRAGLETRPARGGRLLERRLLALRPVRLRRVDSSRRRPPRHPDRSASAADRRSAGQHRRIMNRPGQQSVRQLSVTG